jgi:alpha-beta hydrolase superfamily lysophospholipase
MHNNLMSFKCRVVSQVFTMLLCTPFLLKAQVDNEGTARIDTAKITQQAEKLVNSPDPVFKPFEMPKMDSAQLSDLGFDQVYKSEPVNFVMRDGKKLHAEKFAANSDITIVLLHGVLSSSYTMNRMAGLLREAGSAEVIALDMRGHGQSEGTPGDVDYVGQYTDDLADVITSLRLLRPGCRIIIAAHSMGGGIALRYAMKANAPDVSGYLLFSPLLGNNSPTIPKPSADADTAKAFLKINIMRIIGLKMYNSIGVHTYDSLPVLFFNMPKEMHLTKYTYRANQSMAPEDYRAGLNAVQRPLLVIIGSKDEAFVASAFEPAIKSNSIGEVVIIEGATHDGIRHNKMAMSTASAWFKTLSK